MSDKRALVIGVDSFDIGLRLPELPGATKDALDIAGLLRTHDDDTPNWEVTELVREKGDDGLPRAVGRDRMEAAVNALFDLPSLDSDGRPLEPTVDLLIYYSGHAVRTGTGVIHLSARDGNGLAFATLMQHLQNVNALSVTVILDCCMSGALANQRHRDALLPDPALMLENVTILAAARSHEDAKQHPTRGGLFSERLQGGLQGAAADLLGNVTALSLYAHASGAFAEGHQRPTFKSHSVRPVVLRRTAPQVPLERLSQITTIFESASTPVYLTEEHEGDEADPAFTDRRDPDRESYNGTEKQIELDHLKAYRDAHLVASDDGRDFYFLCTDTVHERKSVSLTALGQYFWELTDAGLLGTVSDAPTA